MTGKDDETQCRGCDKMVDSIFASDYTCEMCYKDLYFCEDCKDSNEPEHQFCPDCWGKSIEEDLKEDENKKRKRGVEEKKENKKIKRRNCWKCKPLTNELKMLRCRGCVKANEKCFCTKDDCVACNKRVWEPLRPRIRSQSIDLTKEETPKISEPVLVSTVTSEKPKILSYLYSHPPQKELTDNPPPLEPIEEVKTNVTEVDFSPIIPNHSTIMDLRDVRTKLAFRQQELRTLINRLQVELCNNEKDVKVISKFLDHLEK